MKINFQSIIKNILIPAVFLIAFSSCGQRREVYPAQLEVIAITNPDKQKEHLERLLRWLPPDRTQNGPVSFLDETFADWLERTGELPPDFDNMPSIPFLPDPLIMDEGGRKHSHYNYGTMGGKEKMDETASGILYYRNPSPCTQRTCARRF
jgi:hypothetical protein